MSETHLIIGQRYTMPDGTTGVYVGVHHGPHADYYCFQPPGINLFMERLTESQARALVAAPQAGGQS